MKEKQDLLSYIRDGRPMTRNEKIKLIVQLSIPSILAQISATVMFFIDYAMVGHLGENATASVGLVESTTWLMGGLGSAVNLGFSVQVAHYIGAKDFEAAQRVLRQSLVCAFLWALMLCLIGIIIHRQLPFWLGGSDAIAPDASMYFMIICLGGFFFQMAGLGGSMLKCSGNMRIPSALNIMMCVLDVTFNYFFIYQLNMGVKGAAMGTAMAELITAAMMLYFLLWRSDMLGIFRGVRSMKTRRSNNSQFLRPFGSKRAKLERSVLSSQLKIFRPSYDVVKMAFKIGAPMGLQHLLMGSAQVVSTIIVAPLGTVAIAANSMAITVESLCYMPGFGIAEAATTLVGQAIGAGQRLLTRSLAFISVGLGISVMSVMGVLMFVFAPELMAFLSPVDAIVQEGAQALRIEAFAEPMFAASIVANGVFIGAGDTLKPAIMSLSSMWGIRLSLAALLAPRYGLKGVWIAMAIDLTCRGIIFLLRLVKGNWNRQLVKDS